MRRLLEIRGALVLLDLILGIIIVAGALILTAMESASTGSPPL